MTDEIAQLRHPKAGAPTAQYIYRDEDGQAVMVANRFDKPGDKFFVPYDLVAQTWTAPEHRPLYRLDELIAANENRPVIITEGEKCADAIARLGYVSTTTFGGANAAHKTDLSALKGRDVILWPDKDDAGRKYAKGLAVTLHRDYGSLPKIVPTSDFSLRNVTFRTEPGAPPPNLTFKKGWDAADAINDGWGVTEINAFLSQAVPLDMPPASAADRDAAIPFLENMELWHTPDRKPFASIKQGGHWETVALDGSRFKSLLAYAEFQANGKTASAAKLDDQLRQLIGQALFEGEAHQVHTRVAVHNESYVLDLGTPDWSAVEISRDGWRIRNAKEPRFRRSPAWTPCPSPFLAAAIWVCCASS